MTSIENKSTTSTALSEITLDRLRQAVICISSEGKIVEANRRSAELTGFRKSELLQMNVAAIFGELPVSFEAFWAKLKAEGKVSLETTLQHKTGYRFAIEVDTDFIRMGDDEYCCSIITDIRQKKNASAVLESLAENTATATGLGYFEQLVRAITGTLGVRYAIVTECANAERTRVRTLSYADNQELRENVEYDLDGTPCKIVMQGKDFFCTNELEKQFPNEAGVISYLGVPIYSPSTHEVIGHIAALDTIPMHDDQNQSVILRIFANRAGAELERLRQQEQLNESLKSDNIDLQLQLQQSEEQYRDLFELAPIAYVNEELDSHFIRANRAALRILGIRPEEVSSIYGKSLAPNTEEAQRKMQDAFASIGRGTDTSGVVLEMSRKDNGKPVWVQWWSNPDPGGQFTRTMFVDITEQVLMEQEQAVLKAQNKYLLEEIKLNNSFEDIISISKKFQKVLQQIEQVADTDATVLVLGESGTGKELISRAIHNISDRKRKPLVKINCAALPANLIESELFGHERGAFTGAMEKKIGRFELADGGTVFLDEIGELPFELQSKLLRVLQEGEFERLGNPKTMKVNVRVIAATNRNLEEAIRNKEFRADLFYRLNVFPITSPPLRERKEDIPFLVKHFCQKHEMKARKKITTIPSKVMDALTAYDWPGNIRELENIMERAIILSRDGAIEYGDWMPMAKEVAERKNQLLRLEDVEKEHIIEVLKQTGWKVSGEKGAAKILGLNPTTLEARMKKLQIKREF